MAKFVVWGGMLMMAFGGMFMGMKTLNADQGEMVGFAIGEVDANNQVQLQAGQEYDFTYVRNTAQPEKYTAKVKAEPTKFRRKTFEADY